ncbi:carbohydrate kinase family protein [Brevibacillus ginsengisoli]|uniref:carbohydrate kinase family protein n=1 Tax=Brevibacillus ginsengisoli TaxID=363854 RepID=UPI003CF646B3
MSIQGRWLVVGAANVDIKGEPDQTLLLGTSNPGVVHISPGGVARNVAENLGLLGEDVTLCALVGEDTDGESLKQLTASRGVSTVGMLRLANQRTGRYVSIHNEQGEMIAAIADMEINEAWTEEHQALGLEFIREHKVSGVLIDANVPVHVMDAFLEAANVEKIAIVAAPVSPKKALKWRGRLHGVSLLVLNQQEAAVLSGMDIETKSDIEKAAAKLHDQGIAYVFITKGGEGVCAYHNQELVWLSALEAEGKEATGAGDAFTAGVMYALTKTDSLIELAAYGLVMAKSALVSKQSVAELIDIHRLEEAKNEYIRKMGA